jgi:hypothetical protein
MVAGNLLDNMSAADDVVSDHALLLCSVLQPEELEAHDSTNSYCKVRLPVRLSTLAKCLGQ